MLSLSEIARRSTVEPVANLVLLFGLFVGAVVLAIGYQLFMEWVDEAGGDEASGEETPVEPSAAEPEDK